jgi:D-alanine-D-alanine ligase-like ATP-grasp enzyme
MTSTSLVPKMAKAVGISFEELIENIIRLALR